MSPDLRRVLAFFTAVVALGGVAVWGATRLLGLAAGPEAEVITALKRSERDGFQLEVPGATAPLNSKHHRFDRFTILVDPPNRTARATTTLDFTGLFGETQVSSLGVEQIPFSYKSLVWTPVEGFAPRLAAICAVLERRRRALESGDLPALASLSGSADPAQELADPALKVLLQVTSRRYRALAWYIRSEREEVLVSEDYLLSGSLPDRPLEEKGTRSLKLTRRGREFSFSQGLM